MKGFASIFVLVTCFCGLAVAIRWKDCGSTVGQVKSVMVSGCETDPTCQLHKGSTVTFTVVFTPSAKVSDATAVVHGVLAGVPIPFPIPCSKACAGCGLKCPVPQGQQTTYSLQLPVKTEYPDVNVMVKFELKNTGGKDIFCVEVPAEVVP